MLSVLLLALSGTIGITDQLIQRDSGTECHRDISGISGNAAIGWNAPDTRKPLKLTYYIGMSPERAAQVESALKHWGMCIVMELERKPYDQAQLRFVFNTIDGPGRVLARAYYPRSGAGWAGLVEFDNAEVWTDSDFYSVALHEIGHSLGLGHNYTNRESIMYWVFVGNDHVTWVDSLELAKLYQTRLIPPLSHAH